MQSKKQKTKTLICVFAHPDDEAFLLASTLARYSKEKAILVCATSGQQGTTRHIKKNADLGTVREKELKKSAKLLKADKLYLLGFQDGVLHRQNQKEIQKLIEKIFKENNPDVVVTFGPDGVSGHVDHVTIGKITGDAYKNSCSAGNTRLLHLAVLERTDLKNEETGLPPKLSANGAKYIKIFKEKEIDAKIDVGQFWQTRLKALKCHFSQDDVRSFYRQFKENPIEFDAYILAAGKSFLKKPANDLFEGLQD
jgi:LmbE family N-acetylglucosaminyl deacetylase